MNTLKPLLTVAVLAGIGYGVYIRLNAGAGAPPPPVDAGWNTSPAIELPGQSGAAPWDAPGMTEIAAPGSAPPSTQPGNTVPPFGGTAADSPASSAPPFAAVPMDAPPFAPQPSASPPPAAHADIPDNAHSAAPSYPPFDPPTDVAPPVGGHDADPYGSPSGAMRDAPAADPYGDPYGGGSFDAPRDYDRYGTPPDGQTPIDAGHSADPNAAGAGDFAAAMENVQRELENGQLASALRQLTTWYGNPQLAPHEQQRLQMLLDQVAGTVVYSTQSLLEHPYEVQPGERLEMIGEKYQVPWQLLAKINGIQDPGSLQPGERLKVIRGPFEAVVSISRRELVLQTADGLYAGRFQIGIGSEHPPEEGTFAVSDKSENPVYYGRDRAIGAEDPNNPLGERWIGLGRTMAIHGTNNPENIGRTDLPGWISLGDRDVEDVYDILSLGSRVTIRR